MKLSEAFPSRFLKAQDVSAPARATIAGVAMEDLGDARKPVLTFQGRSKQLVVNLTNGRMLAAYFGDEMNAWIGKEIEIYADKTNMKGQIVDCLRVRVPQAPAAPFQAPAQPAAAPAAAGDPNDDIPW